MRFDDGGPATRAVVCARRALASLSFAEFRLGKLSTQMGDYKRARRHYGIFLDTFTRPDPEYQWMVTEARQALARVERRGG
jgi:hypothetical protein